jgi:hypothetical protein
LFQNERKREERGWDGGKRDSEREYKKEEKLF